MLLFRAPKGPAPGLVRYVELAIDLLSPRECAACGRPERGSTFCRVCGGVRAVALGSLAGAPLLVAGSYEPPLSLAIGRFKFQSHSELARPLAALLAGARGSLALSPTDACVPVPLHASRLVERGYNQAALLARAFARSEQMKFMPRLLLRKRATGQQARLGRDARAENVRDAFALRAPPPPRVVLVDDVVTTGATLAACIEVLRTAGSEVVAAIALARASQDLQVPPSSRDSPV